MSTLWDFRNPGQFKQKLTDMASEMQCTMMDSVKHS